MPINTSNRNSRKLSAEEAYNQAIAKNNTLKEPSEDDGGKLFYKGKELKVIHINDIREVVELGRSLYPLDFTLSVKNVWDLEKMSDDRGSLHQNYIYVGFVFGLAYALGYGVR